MDEMERDDEIDNWDVIAREGDFEASLSALQDVVGRLEGGNLRLDLAVKCYELGTLLSRRCERLLDEAELRITRLDEPAESDSVPLNEQ